jgi:two-component system nitrate/nitrite response regulator NarL
LDGDGRVSVEAVLTAAVVAGNEVLRRGIEALLRSVPDIGPVRQCASPEEFAVLARAERFDVVVVTASDLAWLTGNQPDLAAVGTTVLVVVDRAAIDDLPGCLTPADGFLWQQDLTVSRLREALRHSRGGEVPMPPDLARALLARADPTGRRPRGGSAGLTSREREALSLLVRGLSNKQIARELSISSHGAKRLVTSIMLKLDAPNRTLAAVTAIRAGIIDLPEAR